MHCRRALIASAAGMLMASGASGVLALLGPPAAAATASYAVAASGAGVKLSIAGTDFVGGTSKVSAGTGHPVVAEGGGELTPGVVSDQKAVASTAGGSQTANRTCAQPSSPFPAPLSSVVSLGAACGAALAAETGNGVPSASATGQVVSVALGSPSALPSTAVVPGSALATTLQSLLGALPSLPSTGLPLPTVLGQVAKSTGGGGSITSLLVATLGRSTSTVATSGASVVAASKDSGLRVALLDGLGASAGPLLTVSVGAASVQSTADTTTGTVQSTDTPAAVTVTVAPPSGPARTVSVAPGMSQTFLAGTPLATTVAAGAGSTTGQGTGHGTATATGATVDALQGVGAGSTGADGGLAIHLGAATSSASGTLPVPVPVPVASASASAAPPPAPVPAVTGATTVHTGEPWAGPLPLALVLLSLLTGLGLLARRRLLPLVRLAGRAVGRVPVTVSHAAAGSGHRSHLRSPSGPGPGPAASSSGTATDAGGGTGPAVPGEG